MGKAVDFHGLGNGELDMRRLFFGPPGVDAYVLIRDDDAAVAGADHCWFAAITENVELAQALYEQHGGTVSAIWAVHIETLKFEEG